MNKKYVKVTDENKRCHLCGHLTMHRYSVPLYRGPYGPEVPESKRPFYYEHTKVEVPVCEHCLSKNAYDPKLIGLIVCVVIWFGIPAIVFLLFGIFKGIVAIIVCWTIASVFFRILKLDDLFEDEYKFEKKLVDYKDLYRARSYGYHYGAKPDCEGVERMVCKKGRIDW